MAIADLDHVNIRTGRLAEMRRFYVDVVGLEEGPRPGFRFRGAWLYCGPKAAVHLVEVERTPQGREPRIAHFAFRASGLARFLETLDQHGVTHTSNVIADRGIRQINIHDPDGNLVEIQFAADEAAESS